MLFNPQMSRHPKSGCMVLNGHISVKAKQRKKFYFWERCTLVFKSNICCLAKPKCVCILSSMLHFPLHFLFERFIVAFQLQKHVMVETLPTHPQACYSRLQSFIVVRSRCTFAMLTLLTSLLKFRSIGYFYYYWSYYTNTN